MLGQLVFARHLTWCFEFNEVDSAVRNDDAVGNGSVARADEFAAIPTVLTATLDEARFDIALEFLCFWFHVNLLLAGG